MAAISPAPVLGKNVWLAATVVILGSTMSFLDSTIVNVGLNTVAVDLNADLATAQWAITAYLLALAAAIPVSGWAARRIGARSAYIGAVALFTVGSLLCALAETMPQLIAFRVVQGLGGGLIMPVGQIILARVAGPANLPRVMGAIGVPVVLAPVFGPFIGGVLLNVASWPWIFLVNLPVGLIAILCARAFVEKDEPEGPAPLDVLGLVLVSAGMVGVTYGLGKLATGRIAVTCLIAGAALLALFVLRSIRTSHPLFDLKLFRIPMFRAATVASFLLAAGLYSGGVLMPLYFQVIRGEDALQTAALLAPAGIGAAIGSYLSGRAATKIGAGRTALIGALISLVASIPFAFLSESTPYPVVIAASLIVGLGTGLSVMPAMMSAYRVLPQHKISDASPQLNMVQRLGGSIATAVLVVILQTGLNASDPDAFATAFRWSLVAAALAAVATVHLARIQARG